jgi:UDP-N-acetylmuramyl tripeptide synthase
VAAALHEPGGDPIAAAEGVEQLDPDPGRPAKIPS